MGEEKSNSESKQDQNKPELFTERPNPSLRQAVELIASLMSQSYSVKVFSGKWQSIRNKLDELHSNLSTIENCDSGENPSLSGIIQSITTTLHDCSDHVRRCVDLSYSGKLLMKSDLDIVSTKLETHIKSLSEILTLGLLTHNTAIVVLKPGLTASREDMKFYVNDLISRLKIGSTEMKKQALISFNEVIHEDDQYIKIAVEIEKFVCVLVSFLDSQETEIQELAGKSISVIAGFQSYRVSLLSAGIIAPLIRVLECGSELGKEFAARCLMKVTENSENSWSISAHGGVTALLKICTNCDCGGELVGLACGVLKNLVGVEEIKRFIVEEGAISDFIKLAKSKDEVIQICAIDFLQNLGFEDESIRNLIVHEGGIRVLIRVLDPKSAFSSKAREMALRAIGNLCFSSMSSLNLLTNYGFMDHVLYFLRNGEVSIQELALKSAFSMSKTSMETKKAMGDAGFMLELVKFLDSKSYEVREIAFETLSTMVLVPRNRRKFVQNDQNVGFLLQLLDPEEGNSGSRKLLLSILMSLTNCNTARKKILNSGYLKNIQKLAEAEVSDAKKIVKKLSANRFRSIMNGIWHS